MSEYFVTHPFGVNRAGKEQKLPTIEERRDQIWRASFEAIGDHASQHIGDVTEVILLTIQGASLRKVGKRAKFLQSLGRGRRYMVSRFLTQMTSSRYHHIFNGLS